MATLNDFKIIKQHSLKYAEFLSLPNDINKDDAARYGFYLFALECITNVKSIDELDSMILDTDYLKNLKKINNDDLGIDAIYIDNEKKEINLFYFKYRQKFNVDKLQSQNDAIISTKFINALNNEFTDNLTDVTASFAQEIIAHLGSDDVWDMKLIMVSNENNGLSTEDSTISQLQENYGLQISSYTLNEFASFITKRPENNHCTLLLDKDVALSYTEDTLSSSKSYLFKLDILELLRITNTDINLRSSYNLEDTRPLKKAELDFSLLFDNVRGYLGQTKYNGNILKTLSIEPTKFFMYNNGITLTADDIKVSKVNANKKLKIELINYQIVNGGQTLRTIFEHNKKNKMSDGFDGLEDASILIRAFKTSDEKGLTNRIAEYTNSQNAIESSDLKALDSLQINIESALKAEKILYSRKAGDVGITSASYLMKISMEEMAQILYSMQGFPHKATNDKQKLFNEHYDIIFNSEELDLDIIPQICKNHDNIRKIYRNNTNSQFYKGYHLKDLYIHFILSYKSIEIFTDQQINDAIELLEDTLKKYRSEINLSDSRKLIQKGFKDQLVSVIDQTSIDFDSL